MPSEPGFLRIGVTGGIGAGKSEVCAAFARKGRSVLQADLIARGLMASDARIRKRIVALCGEESYNPDGTLNTGHVAQVIFSDEKKRAQVNAAVHPAVHRQIATEITAMPDDRRRPYVLVEAALLYESGMDKDLDAVLVVHANDTVRIGRAMARGGVTREEVVRRMRAQMPAGAKREKADFVIVNEGSIGELESRVAFFDILFTTMAG
jgi:dephospho-CoA kinase